MKSSLTPVLRVPDSRGGSAIANPENINAAIGPGASFVPIRLLFRAGIR